MHERLGAGHQGCKLHIIEEGASLMPGPFRRASLMPLVFVLMVIADQKGNDV